MRATRVRRILGQRFVSTSVCVCVGVRSWCVGSLCPHVRVIACRSSQKVLTNREQSHEMLKLVPELKMKVVKRCSGHGGSWGAEAVRKN